MPAPLTVVPVLLLRGMRRYGPAVLLAVAPHGMQLTARRNAWSSMAEDAARVRARREAAAALALLQARSASGSRPDTRVSAAR